MKHHFDMSSDITYDEIEAKVILSKTTGNEKLRFIVVLTITAPGRKLVPMIMFKNLKSIPKPKKGEMWPEGKRHQVQFLIRLQFIC